MTSPVLALLNGIPGSGKSTLARSWAARHEDPLALALDVDVVRGMLGGWATEPLAAGRAARVIAVAAIGVHLRAGHDVVVPQYLRRPDFIDELARAAHQAGAPFLECAIEVEAATAAERLRSRVAAAAAPGPEGPLEGSISEVDAEFALFLATRSATVLLRDPAVADLDRAISAVRSARAD